MVAYVRPDCGPWLMAMQFFLVLEPSNQGGYHLHVYGALFRTPLAACYRPCFRARIPEVALSI